MSSKNLYMTAQRVARALATIRPVRKRRYKLDRGMLVIATMMLIPALFLTYGLVTGGWKLSGHQPTPAFVQCWGMTILTYWASYVMREER